MRKEGESGVKSQGIEGKGEERKGFYRVTTELDREKNS